MTAEPMAIIHFLRICKNNGYDKTYPAHMQKQRI